MARTKLPLPVQPSELVNYLHWHTTHEKTPLPDLLQPFRQHEAELRGLFAQEPEHESLSDPHVNIVPVFNGQESNIRVLARDLSAESQEEKERYVMPLNDEERKPNGAPAVVQSFKEFQTNFNLFSESSLVDLDWNNVVAAGSSVVTSLLPVPEKYGESKKTLRQYYHEILAPASDVDLFLYGLTEDEAVEKIKQIERSIKDAILYETTTIRTKNAITIVSQYPTRHVQIVLRIYKSVSEILTGFDVDCSCTAYDGKQVYMSPRALAAFVTQTNEVDLTRRSPSYENRLSKYSHRGFEVYWPQLDRSRIDPTIFERSFSRTVGLARLLVLEKLPKASDRDRYMDQRRSERGRPPIQRYTRSRRSLHGNIKDDYDDEVADWVEEDEVSNYHTFTIPYGQKFHARKIEKLLYTKDLLLNAEWNKPKDREVNLHRHPAFFGSVEDVIHDCCGYCPKPSTPEEEEVAAEESKTFISGDISFIKDDPGRQAIGSFNPITDDDWTEMAYVGNTTRLCQAIADGDLEHVQDWLAQEGSDPNRRDYTGRTPLHLAVTSSTLEIVQCLVDHGARLIARLADGRTALHLAAARGDVQMVRALLQKSEQNEEEEARKEDLRRESKAATVSKQDDNANPEKGEDDVEMVGSDEGDSDEDVAMRSITTGSFVNVKRGGNESNGNLLQDEDNDDPDVYDVNVVAWDAPCSPLHLAILHGHVDVVQELVQNFGADVLLPVKILGYERRATSAILTLVLALQLPPEKAQEMTQTLLRLGASSAQADMRQATALHYYAETGPHLLQTLFEHDGPAAKRALDHLAVDGSVYNYSAVSPLMAAIETRNTVGALKLLNAGASTSVEFDTFMKSFLTKFDTNWQWLRSRDPEENQKEFKKGIEQPVILTVQYEQPAVALELLRRGADPNTLTRLGQSCLLDQWTRRQNRGESLLDLVQRKLTELRKFLSGPEQEQPHPPPEQLREDACYLSEYEEGSYKYWIAKKELQRKKEDLASSAKRQQEEAERLKKESEAEGMKKKKEAAENLMTQLEEVMSELAKKGARTFKELYPDLESPIEKSTQNYKAPKTEPFSIKFSFQVPDLTDARKEGYLELYEAAWSGDLQTIKKLTLAPWGLEADRPPLAIAIEDSKGFSPFHIAVLRGHLDVAKATLEIAQAQYQPKADKRRTYTMTEDDDSCSEDGSEGGSDEIRVYSTLVDEQFTIENIGEVSMQVKSDVTPLWMLNRGCAVASMLDDEEKNSSIGLSYDSRTGRKFRRLSQKSTGGKAPRKQLTPGEGRPLQFERAAYEDVQYRLGAFASLLKYAIYVDDLDLARYLLELGAEFSAHAKGDDDPPRIYSVSHNDFKYAMKLGRIQILAEIIKRTGAGIPLEELVKKSGVEVTEKPKYYRGLSVHGTKRADWAAAGRGDRVEQPTLKHPPLLEAAFSGNIDSVEWFLSDAPMRHYSAFASANRSDERLQNLAKASGGIDQSLSEWLDTRNDLILHCAILSKPNPDSISIINYIIRAVPSSLEKKSRSGHTPFHLASSLCRVAAAKALLAAGADPMTRDHRGNNVLHSLFCPISSYGISDEKHPREMLDLLGRDLFATLSTQRSADGPGSATPLACWMKGASSSAAVMRTLLSFSADGEELELIDGAGDTPLHTAVRMRDRDLLEIMLEKRPDLLHRENATGRTPVEMAQDAWVAEVMGKAPTLKGLSNGSYHYYYTTNVRGLVDRTPESFIAEQDDRTPTRMVWDVCREWMGKEELQGEATGTKRKRKLVSLFEANEVAKRVAARHGARALFGMGELENGRVKEEDEEQGDEVTAWYSTADQWGEYEEKQDKPDEEKEDDGEEARARQIKVMEATMARLAAHNLDYIPCQGTMAYAR